jgi:hypothetical protein
VDESHDIERNNNLRACLMTTVNSIKVYKIIT